MVLGRKVLLLGGWFIKHTGLLYHNNILILFYSNFGLVHIEADSVRKGEDLFIMCMMPDIPSCHLFLMCKLFVMLSLHSQCMYVPVSRGKDSKE